MNGTYAAAVCLLLPSYFQGAETSLVSAVWTSHHWLFQDGVQDKLFFGAAFQGKLSGDFKLISLTFLWSLEEVRKYPPALREWRHQALRGQV